MRTIHNINDILTSEFLSTLQIVDWGVVRSSTPKTFDKYELWASKGYAGPLSYLEDHRKNIRSDLKNFFPEFSSALVFLFDYKKAKKFLSKVEKKSSIAAYTIGFDGHDYHHVIENYLEQIKNKISAQYPDVKYQVAIDMHPVLDRDLAYSAGLGWFGKNSMLISRDHGSFTMIGSLLLSIDIDSDEVILESDHCGSCNACITACPTDAIIEEERIINASKCISTYTIEVFKEGKAPQGMENEDYIFGCDICQDVCPWNKKPLLKIDLKDYSPSELMKNIVDFFVTNEKESLAIKLSQMSGRFYRKIFKGTSFFRSGKNGVLKNLKVFFRN